MYYRILSLLTAVLLLCNSFYLQAQTEDRAKWINILKQHASRIGISETDIDNAQVRNLYTDAKTGITYAYLQQTFQQVRVYNTIITVALKGEKLMYSSGRFIKNTGDRTAGRSKAAIDPLDAVRIAARHLKLSIEGQVRISKDRFDAEKKYLIKADSLARQDVEVEQFWKPSADQKQLRLVWNVIIDDRYSHDWWVVSIDAITGEYVDKINRTEYEVQPDTTQALNNKKQEVYWPVGNMAPKNVEGAVARKPRLAPVQATYQIIPYPAASPDERAPDLRVDPWTVFGPGNPATTLGWHSDMTNDYIITRGNNAFSYLGQKATIVSDPVFNWPDTAIVSGSRLHFLQIPDFSLFPNDSTAPQNKKFAIDNLFYWMNMAHDISYQYGFTEAAGNFQASNLGRGGIENDMMLGQAQLSSGYNNAYYGGGFDGGPGRIQFLLWTGRPVLKIHNNPGSIEYESAENRFTANNKLRTKGPVTADVVLYNDDTAGTIHHGCQPATNNITGKIAMVDSDGGPGCPDFAYIAMNCQAAGAVGVIVYAAGEFLFSPPGNAPTLTIPLIVVKKSTGDLIMSRLANNETVNVTITPLLRDGSVDNTVILHEYGHGIADRMTATGNCLVGTEVPKEGWADYMALMMATDWENLTLDDSTMRRSVGAYAMYQLPGQPGVRFAPYSIDMSVQPRTYAHVAANTETHAVGEVFCAALWDLTWELIRQTGSVTGGFHDNTGTGGNVIAMNLVMTGMKLQPCSPGFLDARDAILAADSILYNKQYQCAIWRAFARRGMGARAIQGSSGSGTDQVANFELPVTLSGITDTVANTGTNLTITHTISCPCSPLTAAIIRDTIPYGFSYVSSEPSGELQSGGILHFPPTNIAAGETKTFTITLEPFAAACIPDTVIHDNRDGKTLGNFTANVEQEPNTGWGVIAGGNQGDAWFALETPHPSVINLVSEPTTGSAGKSLSILSFMHLFDTEKNFDGGIIEYSTDGVTWADLGPYIIENGYTGSMNGTKFVGQMTFTGNSGGFIRTLVDLSSFGNTPIRIRFRFASDDLLAGNGWKVDDIIRVNQCGGIMKTGLYYTMFGDAQFSTLTRLQVVPPAAPLPLTLISFEAKQSGDENLLQWKTESEVNVKEFGIEFSKDGLEWTTIGIVAARNETVNHYSYKHTQPVNGANYYRLKMKDLDGTAKYSGVRIVNRITGNHFTLQPNPAKGTAHFYFSVSLRLKTIRIYDGAGRLVKQVQLTPGSNYYEMPLGELSPGIYMAEGTGEQGKELLRFAVHK